MKVVLFNGSRREKGCTYTALSLVAGELKAAGIETEIFFVGGRVLKGETDAVVHEAKEIRQYIEWFNEGDSTLSQRLSLFENRRKILEREMARLTVVMNKIRYKELLYREAVRVGNLDIAANERRLKYLKKKLFESPDDFDK